MCLRRRALLLAAFVFALPVVPKIGLAPIAVAQAPIKPTISVVEPWARATPAGAKVGAAYLELKAGAGSGDKLVAASSAVAGTVELHTHIMDGSVARMRRVDAIEVPAGGSVSLRPGGFHIMLMNLKGQLNAGDSFQLKLVFEKAGSIDVDVKVQPIGGGSAGGGHHKH
jgi:copper(I)-binding protein